MQEASGSTEPESSLHVEHVDAGSLGYQRPGCGHGLLTGRAETVLGRLHSRCSSAVPGV